MAEESAMQQKTTRTLVSGFTLIELIVVLGIVLVITTVLLFSTQQFNSAILLRSLAYEVGLSVREAQLYGVSVKESATGSQNFSAAYGIYLPASVLNVPNASYVVFADTYPSQGDGLYTPGSDTIADTFSLQNGFTISDFCVMQNGTTQCASSGAIHSLTILFRRPDPDAIIATDISSGPYASASITVSSPGRATRSVSVSSTGQITVNLNEN